MENIFDIFGSHGQVSTIKVNPLPHEFSTVKSTTASQGLPSSKQIIDNASFISKGKKVLGDAGNKIKGLEKNSNEHSKENLQNSTSTPKFSSKSVFPGNNCLEKNTLQENTKISSCFEWENCNSSESWPPTETQGPSFWQDDDCGGIWPPTEGPAIDDFLCVATMWEIGKKHVEEQVLSLSPLSIDMNDSFDFHQDVPDLHSNSLVLEMDEVKFPWEL